MSLPAAARTSASRAVPVSGGAHGAAPLAQPTPGSLGAPAPGAAAPQGQAVGVSIAQFAFVPATITISAEQSITWTNNDPVDHTTTVMTRSGTRAS
jgi:plastocyanin